MVEEHFYNAYHCLVFDGYKNVNTKDMTHKGQSNGNGGVTVAVAANMTTTIGKDQLLANQNNKQQFIFMLSTELEKR